MSAEDLEKYETEMELTLYREYRDVVAIFKYVVETDRRFYLCNQVDVKARSEAGEVFFEVSMSDAWVWDMYRPARFAKTVKVLTFKDVNVEELNQTDIDPPKTQASRNVARYAVGETPTARWKCRRRVAAVPMPQLAAICSTDASVRSR